VNLRANITVRWVMAILWMALIFWLSSFPELRAVSVGQSIGVIPHIDRAGEKLLELFLRKSAHVALYAVLAVLCYWACSVTDLWRMRHRPYTWAAGISTVRAMLDEIHQAFVPGRDGALMDVGFDALGVLAGLALVHAMSCVYRMRKPKKNPPQHSKTRFHCRWRR